MGRKSGGVMYFLSGRGEYYRIDSDFLPKKVCPITQFNLEMASWGWTVVDKCIYCIGGIKKAEADEELRHTVGKTLYKYNYNTTEKYNTTESTWECMKPNRNLGWCKTSVFAFGRKMYVVGGYDLRPHSKCDKDTDLTLPGEYYNLDSGTWQYMPKMEGIQHFKTIARVMDDKTTILFYNGDTFLFYNLVEDAWKDDDRLSNVPLSNWNGLENCHCRDILFSVINNARPMVCDSTLYWFNMDMCLYGFDYSRKRWFQSNSLQQKLEWPLRLHRDNLCDIPLLLYLNNQTFVALYAISGSKVLALAIITVKRDANSGSLKVSLKSSQYIDVETSHSMIDIVGGMTLDASAEEKEVEKGQWRLPTFFRAIGVIGAVAFVAVASGFYKKSH